jgi:hypothetical protein
VEFNKLLNDILNYSQANPAGAIAAGIILLLLLIRRPKLFFTLLLMGLAAVGVLHLFAKLSGMGLAK